MSSNHWLLPLVTSSHYYDDNNLSLLNARAWLYKYGDRKLYPWLKLTPLSPMRSFSFLLLLLKRPGAGVQVPTSNENPAR